jgi:hypothetical protein
MKKIFFTLIIITFAIMTNAQEIANQTIGLRLGNYYGLSYQKKLSDDNRVEIGLAHWGYSTYKDTKVDIYYHKVFDFESMEKMNWFIGAGGGAGFWKFESRYYYDYYDYDDSGTYFFVGGTAGIEYKFDFPLMISLDLRPELSFGSFYDGFHFNGGLGVRYVF